MFCDPVIWKAPKFPRDSFYDSNCKRGRVLMHTKVRLQSSESAQFVTTSLQMILGIFERDNNFTVKGKRKGDPYDTDDDDDEVQIVSDKPAKKREKLAGWLYVGSHNFTPSAWGTLSGSRITPVLNVRHGLVFKEIMMTSFSDHELRAGRRDAYQETRTAGRDGCVEASRTEVQSS